MVIAGSPIPFLLRKLTNSFNFKTSLESMAKQTENIVRLSSTHCLCAFSYNVESGLEGF